MTLGSVTKPIIAGIILAAGQSRRMGEVNKLLVRFKHKSLIQHIAGSALDAGLDEVIIVTGYQADRIEAQLSGLKVNFAHNQDYATGLSSSLKAGIEALPANVEAALVLLSDMPFITRDIIMAVTSSYSAEHKQRILVPYCKAKRGNPVLWPRYYFDELSSLSGNRGARQLFNKYRDAITKIELGEEIFIDIDTAENAANYGIKTQKGKGRE